MDDRQLWYAGVDWGSQSHHVVLTDGDGRKIGERSFLAQSRRSRAGHQEVRKELRRRPTTGLPRPPRQRRLPLGASHHWPTARRTCQIDLEQLRSRRSAALRSPWCARAMILFARSLSFAFGFVGQVEDLQMSSSAVDIAWISCGPNTLSSGRVLPS